MYLIHHSLPFVNLGNIALIHVFLSSNVVLKWFFGGIVQVRGQHWEEREKEVEHNMSTLFLQLTQVLTQVAQAYYESPEQHYPTQLINYSYDNSYKTLYENYSISP